MILKRYHERFTKRRTYFAALKFVQPVFSNNFQARRFDWTLNDKDFEFDIIGRGLHEYLNLLGGHRVLVDGRFVTMDLFA